MCAICGIWDFGSPHTLRRRVEAATRLAAHRGPDDEGFALLGRGGYAAWGGHAPEEADHAGEVLHLALGHRRLSIIDLSAAGHQPFATNDRRYWIVLNGEIYNYRELRAELENLGISFVSRTDTEVVLAAWCTWGDACLERFNGMWSFAIFDRAREVLFCSRDRFGVKPFCYSIQRGKFVFASETKQLLVELGGHPRVNVATLADFFFWGYQGHSSATFLEGCETLPAGHLLRVSKEDVRRGVVVPIRYWAPRADPQVEFRVASEQLGELLRDAVHLRLRSDVPVGVTLSGGLDSSSVACLAAADPSGGPLNAIRAFNVAYPDPFSSEEEYAQATAERCGMSLVVIRPTSDELVDDWERFVRGMDEPFNGLSYYSNWKVYQAIRAHQVPVVMNGQGADELLLGYPRYRVPFLLHLVRHGRPDALVSEMHKCRRNGNMGFARQLAYVLYFLSPTLRRARRLQLVRRYLRREFLHLGREGRARFIEGAVCRQWPEFLEEEFTRYQMPHLLHHDDAVSMQFAVEARQPFLDYRLFNLVIGQDIRALLRDGWSKALLRESMRYVVPDRVRLRRDKMGFNTPSQRLLRDNSLFFIDLLRRNWRDPCLNVHTLEQDFCLGRVNEGFLCSALSYLAWRELFGVGW